MGKIVHVVSNLAKNLSKLVIAVVIFCGLFVTFANVVTRAVTKYYEKTDIPDEKFRVLAIDENGNDRPVNWETAQSYPISMIKHKQTSTDSEDFLGVRNDRVLSYHNEGALWYSQSKYRIQNNKIVPISFRFITFIHFFIALILTICAFAIGKYMVTRWSLRKYPDKLQDYNQRVLKSLKKYTITIGLLVILYMGISFAGAA
ncbi:MAG: hypothetical protein KGV50_00995 [Gammaproteobacteria bacterium]|nr:hypothetical protein [Gammaproteobacteria bacterium]